MTSGMLHQLQVRLTAAHNTLGKLLAPLTFWPTKRCGHLLQFFPIVQWCLLLGQMRTAQILTICVILSSITSYANWYLPRLSFELISTCKSKIAEICSSHNLHVSSSLLPSKWDIFHCSDWPDVTTIDNEHILASDFVVIILFGGFRIWLSESKAASDSFPGSEVRDGSCTSKLQYKLTWIILFFVWKNQPLSMIGHH